MKINLFQNVPHQCVTQSTVTSKWITKWLIAWKHTRSTWYLRNQPCMRFRKKYRYSSSHCFFKLPAKLCIFQLVPLSSLTRHSSSNSYTCSLQQNQATPNNNTGLPASLLSSLFSTLADNGGNSLEIFTCQFLVDSYCSQRRLCFVQGSRWLEEGCLIRFLM